MPVSKLAALTAPRGCAAESVFAGSTTTSTTEVSCVEIPPKACPRDANTRTGTFACGLDGVHDPVHTPLSLSDDRVARSTALERSLAVALCEGNSGSPQGASLICTWNVCASPTCNCAFSPGLLNVATSVFGVQAAAGAGRSPIFKLIPVTLAPGVATSATWMV